jgi:hypothetical protein
MLGRAAGIWVQQDRYLGGCGTQIAALAFGGGQQLVQIQQQQNLIMELHGHLEEI